MNNDLISIIVPVFNSAGTITRCLRSLLHQTYSFLEIIIVYLESSDETLCKKCGWSWTLAFDGNWEGADYNACGGTAICEALEGPGAKWVATPTSGTWCEEYYTSYNCYEAGTWCWSYSGGYDDCPMTEIRCGLSYEDADNYCHVIAPSTCISIYQP